MSGSTGSPFRWRISEESHQRTVMDWAAKMRRRWMLDDRTSALDMLYHVPNGGKRLKGVAGALKALGLKKGVPDLVLPVPKLAPATAKHAVRGLYAGLYLEMKKLDAGDTSPEQRWWLHYLASLGYATAVCEGNEEAIDCLTLYLNLEKP